MNSLCAEIGYRSINKFGEQLCGDHIDVVEVNEESTVIVLADGLGSGVKANILSTLTAKIISTMMAAGLSIEECIATITATLPVCSVRGVAYSTFTIIHLLNSEEAELIEYDNPHIILIRDNQNHELEKTQTIIEGKKVHRSRVKLKVDDVFIAISDGCVHAGVGMKLNFGWERKHIIKFMEDFVTAGFSAKNLSTILIDECNKLYDNHPGDDTTACVVRIRKRKSLNLLFGPSFYKEDQEKMLKEFFEMKGRHIVSGGTTSKIVSEFLNKPIRTSIDFVDPEIPPIAHIDGVDLVTEGVITINKVLTYAKDHIADNDSYSHWSSKKDGASLISRMLFEEATDINFMIGRAINPAHQNPDLPINFNIKMQLVTELSECLKKMGKRVKVKFF